MTGFVVYGWTTLLHVTTAARLAALRAAPAG